MPEDGPGAENSKSKPLDSNQHSHDSDSHSPANHDDSSAVPNAPHVSSDELDDFGLPIRKAPKRSYTDQDHVEQDSPDQPEYTTSPSPEAIPSSVLASPLPEQHEPKVQSSQIEPSPPSEPVNGTVISAAANANAAKTHDGNEKHDPDSEANLPPVQTEKASPVEHVFPPPHDSEHTREPSASAATSATVTVDPQERDEAKTAVIASQSGNAQHAGPSEWSHQHVVSHAKEEEASAEDDAWQEMPAYATHTIYDDWGKVVAREIAELDEEEAAYGHLGGAGKGYTKVQLDEDAQSATSMDEDTAYLFKPGAAPNTLIDEDEGRDMLSQMQATKDLLTEGQRIAYVGLVRLSMMEMVKDLERLERTKAVKKHLETATESMQMWSQKMMVRLYSHMEIDAAEQIMIEQLAQHGVEPADLTPTLMQNARVKNPVAHHSSANASVTSLPRGSTNVSGGPSSPPQTSQPGTPGLYDDASQFPQHPPSHAPLKTSLPSPESSLPATPDIPPPYEQENPPDYLTLKDPSELGKSKSIDLDLRWTVLCDLFLVLIADSVYDSRSRTLLELVGSALSIPWVDICRFEKRVTDALEMQEAADKENWNEDEHMNQRKKSARNRRLVMMGLATVGGGLVIGLSAGLLAPVIGAGLAAGFTTIGVAGTSGFLAGAGGAAIITSTGALAGGTIAVRASNRRTGAVKTFEYRPLYNNKRVNLIVTVAGWMTGKVDDVRLPFSTVDPIMGDMYSVFWEPEMLRSMGDTINILATEALTQGLQQILGSTILIALMSAMQLPLVLTKLSYLIDNPWSVSLARADLAGLILADSLIDRNLGVRPITLVGFSIGSRVIFSCLKELANRGAFGLIQNAYLFGSPMVVKKDEYLRAKSVVSGRFINGYANNDWILGYLFRATSGGIMRVAGLAPVEIPGIENYDVTKLVPGHMAYRKAMPRLLREVGWMVDSDDFAEIEDPDPENHEVRQRELINEIEEARRALEKKPEKKGIKALFTRNKKNAERKAWEVYEEQSKAESSSDGAAAAAAARGSSEINGAGSVLFDVDAIRAEVADLATQGIEVKEIKSTLPPMKLNLDNKQTLDANGGLTSPRSTSLRQTKSYSGLTDSRPGSSSSGGNRSASSGWGGGAASARTGYKDYDYDENDQISMTFDSGPDRPSPVLKTNGSIHGPSPLASPPLPTLDSLHSQRPPLTSSHTMPITHVNPEHNAWADEVEDDEFGKEKEMSMTFE